jgi:hypothetical protein
MMECVTQCDPIESNIHWPNQQRPPKSGWDIWRDFILLFSDANIFLLKPLGDWIEQDNCIRPWKWYSTEDPNTILEQTGDLCYQRRKQVWGINKQFRERQRLNYTPTLKARELALIHRSSIERKDSTPIETACYEAYDYLATLG